MCRMMGIVAKDFVRKEWILPFESLAARGKIRSDMSVPGHHDGWGMVTYYTESFPEYVERQPHSVAEDPGLYRNNAQTLERTHCKTALIHFRKLSVGKPAISNTHPFLHQEWAFCHNGTIEESGNILLTKLKPHGTTDSERFFFYLLEQIRAEPGPDSLRRAIEPVRAQFYSTSLTFLLTNGKSLFAYRQCDPKFEDYYTLYRAQSGSGTILCSEPLTEISSNWESLPNGSLIECS